MSQEEIVFELKVFQYSEYQYVIGLVELEQLNDNSYAFNIHNALFVNYEEELGMMILNDNILVDSSYIYNLNKNKVISIFTPSPEFEFEYYNEINNKNNDESDESEIDEYSFHQVGAIQ